MSENLPDPAIPTIADRFVPSTTDASQVQPGFALSEVSSRDKPWDKHKAYADRVESLYKGSEFDSYSARIHFCSDFLEFGLQPDEEALRLKLRNARFCRVPRCPICQWRRSLRWKAKAYEVLPKILQSYPTHRWLFLTLTQRNVPIDSLRENLTAMNKGYQRMIQRQIWPGVGWLRSTEVTQGEIGAHPHFHCLLMVKPSYFTRGYLSHDAWVHLWQSCMRLDYVPVVDIRAVRHDLQPTMLIPEVIKYVTKESEMVSDRAWFLELTRQLHKLRLIATGGVLRQYLKELQQEPTDLIGESDDSSMEDLMSLYFRWRRQESKYRLD